MPKQLPYAKDFVYKLPEGYTLPEQFRAKLDTLVDKTGMSNEDAQEFIDLHIAITEDFIHRLNEATVGAAVYAESSETKH